MKTKTIIRAAAFAVALSLSAVPLAQEHSLRIQTHWPPESVSGQNAGQFAKDLEAMSNGRIKVEMFFSAAVVKPVESFSAVQDGILDVEMTGASYQVGKDKAFQFMGDLLGGYGTPMQQTAWLKFGGGRALADELYHSYGMHLVCWWWSGPESLVSTRPLRGLQDVKDWKFRAPPGLITDVFTEFGAKPVVMPFTEVYNALNTGIVEGADAASLAGNVGLGLYDVAKHTIYPGFHSMPADHVAINKAKWDSLPPELQAVMTGACDKLTINSTLDSFVKNYEAAENLKKQGVTLYEWSEEDRKKYRAVVAKHWDNYAETPMAKKLVASHKAFMKKIGLL
ncbi:MAG: TRAP transporter substrate-binding protein [Gammaproteobacteria bacterium]